MAARQAERWLALEYIAAVTVRTVGGFTSGGGMLGAQQYATITLTYGILSLGTMADATADLAAAFGGLILLGMMVRPALDAKGKPTGKPAGAPILEGITGFVKGVGARPTTYAQGYGGHPPAAVGAKPSSTPPSSGSGGGFLDYLTRPIWDSVPSLPSLSDLPKPPDAAPSNNWWDPQQGFAKGIVKTVKDFLNL